MINLWYEVSWKFPLFMPWYDFFFFFQALFSIFHFMHCLWLCLNQAMIYVVYVNDLNTSLWLLFRETQKPPFHWVNVFYQSLFSLDLSGKEVISFAFSLPLIHDIVTRRRRRDRRRWHGCCCCAPFGSRGCLSIDGGGCWQSILFGPVLVAGVVITAKQRGEEKHEDFFLQIIHFCEEWVDLVALVQSVEAPEPWPLNCWSSWLNSLSLSLWLVCCNNGCLCVWQ